MPRPGSRRTRTARKRKADPHDGWYSIRRIVDERAIRGCTEYLVEWQDDPLTGEVYAPTWSREVTDAAKHEWETRALAQEPLKEPGTVSAAGDSISSQESQPPRPANFRQTQRAVASGRPRPPPPSSSSPRTERQQKAPRLRYSYSPSTEPVPSIVSAASPATTSELPELNDDEREGLVVGIPKDPSFEPSEYLSVSVSNTQSNSQSLSQSIAEQEESDCRLVFPSHLSQSTIPDSQEHSAQALSAASQLYTSQQPHTNFPGESAEESPLTQSQLDGGGNGGGANHASSKSTSGVSHIPSHQDIETQLPSLLPVTRQSYDAKPAGSSIPREQSTHSNSGERVHFLTQLDFEPDFSLTSNSSKSQISESPQRVFAVSGSQLDSQKSFSGFKGSQDAQVVDRRFDPPLDKVTDSNETYSNMADSSSDGTPYRRSAVDELHELFNLDSTVADSGSAPPLAGPPQLAGAEPSHPRTDASPTPFSAANDSAEHPQEDAQETPQTQLVAAPEQPEAITAEAPIAEPSATEALHNIIDMAFSTPCAPAETQTLLPHHPHEEEQVTISPAAILGSGMPSLDSQDALPKPTFESSRDPMLLGQGHLQPRSTSSSSVGPAQMQHVVTLPFQANLRPQYEDTLIQQKRDITSFGQAFSGEEFTEPDQSLVERIDELLSKLYALCDYPQDVVGTVLEELTPADQIKYACNANSKICFLFELLQGIETDTKVLIIARSRELLRLLGHLADALEIGRTSATLDPPQADFSDSAASVTLALPEENVDIEAFDLVIGYDHGFGTSPVAHALSPESQTGRPPMVLSLVATHSIEHIDLQLPEDLHPLERKNALLSGIVRARQLINDPDRGYPEPHELASLFCDFLNGKAEDILWEPASLPDEILDVYLSSQSRSQMHTSLEQENARKRKLDDEDDEDVKRMRLIPRESIVRADDVPLPDEVQWLLQSVAAGEESQHGKEVLVKVRMSALQALSEKLTEMERASANSDAVAEYRSLIEGLEKRVKEYERTSNKIYKSHRAAVEDRTKFERLAKKAEAELHTAKQSAEKEDSRAQGKIRELEEKVTRLIGGSDDVAEESPLAISEKLLKDAQDRVQNLEKRLENAKADGEYAKNMYQEASSAGTVLRRENNELREKNEELSKQTPSTMGKIHQLQADSMAKAYLKQIEDLKTQVREREMELDRTRDELRQLKNGRRETRQVSVPRSPRMGVMSPRPPGRPYGGSASRGTSPTLGVEGPLMGTMPTPGNGRWNHLRE